jgi:predicted DsbA family dithiol-disulfide isomerase
MPGTAPPVRVALYSDPVCPYAYLLVYRLLRLREEYRGRVVIDYKSLPLEYVNNCPCPKQALDVETPMLMLSEPGIPYQPWHAPASEWPATMWPALEAIKCAERQGPEFAAVLDWFLRVALFAESRCISMRHELFALAQRSGLDMARFAADFDNGVTKHLVLREAQEGWEQLKVEGSPTLVLPSGRQYSYHALGLPVIKMDEAQHFRAIAYEPAPCYGDDCLDLLRRILAEAVLTSTVLPVVPAGVPV